MARSHLALAAVTSAALATPVLAQDYLITVSGPYRSFTNDGGFFDGASSGPLDPIYNIPRLTGGTFSATFRYRAIASPDTGDFTGYAFAQPAGFTYDLFDSAGSLVHRGTAPTSAGATVGNNLSFLGGAPNDFVNLFCFVNSVTGLVTPAPIYAAEGEVGAIQSIAGFSGGVGPASGGAEYITDLSVPLSATTFLSFPERGFTAGAYFGDGDFLNFEDPYQYIETSVNYDITSVTVTQIPTPGAAGVLALAGLVAAGRRRR